MGLGGYPDVKLSEARERAREARARVVGGIDPIAERQAVESRLRAANTGALTFAQCAERYVEAHRGGWKNAKHAAQWSATLETYACPVMGRLLVRDVELSHVLAALEPIWTAKAETASRLRGRIESVLDWAKARGYRSGDNPARWRNHLDHLLPATGKVARVKHHRALSIGEVGGFMRQLRASEGQGARCLEFAILTAARSAEARGATWSEIDIDEATWTVPAERMKGGREHRVPLSEPVLAMLKSQPRVAGSDLVFVSPRGVVLSDMTLTAVTRRLGINAVPHGFRSTFRDWTSERTGYPRDVAEMALAHAIGDKVEAAYRRGDLFEKRRRMMRDWAAFCARIEGGRNVLEMGSARKVQNAA
jgi:integrase